MGYTHYIVMAGPFTPENWAEFTSQAGRIFATAKAAGIELGDWDGLEGSEPEVLDNAVSFNGIGEDSHESCAVVREGEKFSFCKTARKPYDPVVQAIYLAARAYGEGVEISSDGDINGEEWDEGHLLYQGTSKAEEVGA